MLSNEQFENEKMYGMTMSVIRNMKENGLISEDEYTEIDTIFLDKYHPLLGSLYSEFA